MTTDADQAIWLAGLIARSIASIELSPGLTIEVEDDPKQWIQVIIESDDITQNVNGYILNYPYRQHSIEPLEKLTETGLIPPPDTRIDAWEAGGFARLWIRPDVPLVGLAHFAIDILKKIIGADDSAELTVRIEYGF
ncbi:MAG: hypothetical protein JXJ17_10340 [Anaerolineae bacterium]|nr:hypothetical protein [Anaerolineae bacterium]